MLPSQGLKKHVCVWTKVERRCDCAYLNAKLGGTDESNRLPSKEELAFFFLKG